MNNYFIILAAGTSKRFISNKRKQYFLYKNKALFEHSLEKALNSKLFNKIVLVVDNPKKIKKKYSKNLLIIKGGKERSDSSLIGLKKIKRYKPLNVLIHDAARPNFSIKLINKLLKNLRKNIAVIPIVKSKDSLKYKIKNQIFNLNRNNSLLTQTPQAFKFNKLYNLAINAKNKIPDESTLFIDTNHKIRFISGETNKDKLKGKVGKEYNKINSLNIFYNSIGIGFTNYKNEGCKGNADSGEYTYCENTLTEKPYQIGEVNVISILYNFGNNLFFTVGGDLYASGYLITLDGESGNERVMKNPEPLFLFPTTLQFGLKFSKLELLVEYRDSFIEFKRPDSGHDTIETSGTILFGLGLIF